MHLQRTPSFWLLRSERFVLVFGWLCGDDGVVVDGCGDFLWGVDYVKFGLGEVLVAGSHIHRASLYCNSIWIQLFDVSILSDDLLDYQVTFYGSI